MDAVKTRFHLFRLGSRLGWVLLMGVVLALHGVVLDVLGEQLRDDLTVTPMPQPLFVRMIQPQAPIASQPRRRPVKPRATATVQRKEAQPVTATTLEETTTPDSEPQPAPPDMSPVPDTAPSIESTEPAADPALDGAGDWPADTRLSYSVKGYDRGDFYGSGRVQWQRSAGRYQVQVDLRVMFFVTASFISQGELRETGLQPRVYEEKMMNNVRRLAFDGVDVTFNDGSRAAQPLGLQDTASQFVELSRRFSSGRQALVVGVEVPVWLARPRQMNLWTYDVVALETLQIPEFGEVPAFHLQPRPVANPRGVIAAELWFAPSLQYLPVRIRINFGADRYVDMVVNRIEQGAAQANGVH